MEYKQLRIKKLQKEMKKANIDACLIRKKENYKYFSGFDGSSAYVIITHNNNYLVTDFRYIEQALSQTKNINVLDHKGKVNNIINTIANDEKIVKLGIEDQYITYNEYLNYKDNLKNLELCPIQNLLTKIRAIKDEEEVKIIKNAIGIADKAFEHILSFIKPGVREIDIANEIEFFMKKNGAKGPSFDIIVASGVRSSLPHGVASEKVIKNDEIVLLDFGAIYNGYCSDISRTIFVGNVHKQLIEIYDIVLKAQLEAIHNMQIKMTGNQIDEIARDVIKKHGYAESFGHGLGHGVGLEIHEEPRVSIGGNEEIEKNMVFTVEPGIYVNNIGGVRIEDIVILGESGAKVLTNASKEKIFI